jgi:hypothetical protein
MFTLFVTLLVPSGIPSPHDLLLAETTLISPGGTEVPPQSGRMKTALLVVMSRMGAVDPGIESQWFLPSLLWESEVNYARGVVSKVRACPVVQDTLPPREWFLEEARRVRVLAEAYRQRACEYRTRADWELDRVDALLGWSRWLDGQAEMLFELAGKYEWWGQPSWSRPRRLMLTEVPPLQILR